MSTYEAREKRVIDTVALKEPDRVPIMPPTQTFPVLYAGYTMADILYDSDKGIAAFEKYMVDFEPDAAPGIRFNNIGKGPQLELMQPKTTAWAGAPDGRLDKNSIHQFIEFPVLLEEEMPLFTSDYSGWLIQYGLPRVSGLLEPFADWQLSNMGARSDLTGLASVFSSPKMRNVIETLWKINEMNAPLAKKLADAEERFEKMGFPIWGKGGAGVPFDAYSDMLRGTFGSMVDISQNPEIIEQFCAKQMEQTLASIRAQGKVIPGKWVFMALHKGMDTFLSDKQYRDLYWNDLKVIIEEIIKNGMVPYIYTEGPYNSRLDCLTEVEPNKVVYHFETVDMAEAKKKLGDIACISGGFPLVTLHYGTKQQVIDECKRLLDICAPGGGYIFATAAGFDNAPVENVEAMFETVKTYGKY